MNSRKENNQMIYASVQPIFGTWLRNWWITPLQCKPSGRQPAQAYDHSAFHQAYRRFAQTEPTWVQRRFDAAFLRPFILGRDALPTAGELAWAWDQQFGALCAPSVRIRQATELTVVAAEFLRLLAKENAQ